MNPTTFLFRYRRLIGPLALALFGATSPGAQGEWSQQAPDPSGLDMHGVHMLSALEAWVVGKEFVGSAAVVMHTTDGGQLWDVTDMPTNSLHAVFFLDAQHGWVTGNGFFYTTNGGQTWVSSGALGTVYDIFFVDLQNGWACGNGGTTYRTTDGGVTWSSQAVGNITTLGSIFFLDQQTGWTGNIGGDIYKSTDGGQTWTLKASTGGANLTVQFLDATGGWAIGGNTFYHTTDGGETWPQVSVPSGTWAYDAYFSDHQNGWAIGGKSVRTTDGGLTWQVMPEAASYQYLSGIYFTDATTGIYVGDTGIVQYTTDGGATWSARTSGGAGATHGLDAVDELHAWAANDGGEVLYTEDGGNRWQRTYVPSFDKYGRVTDVDFVDLSTGWAVGTSSSFGGGDSGQITRSTDGGKSFQLQKTFGNDMDAIEAVDAQTAFAAGFRDSVGGFVLRTTNGGQTWVDISPSGAVHSDLEFLDAATGWVAGAAIYHTQDGGASWITQHVGMGSIDHLEAISMADANHGWAVGWFGTVLRTEDGGSTWTPQTAPPGWVNVFKDVHAIDADTAWIVGGGGYFAYTFDGGQSWTREVPAAGYQYTFEATYFVDQHQGWIAGVYKYPHGGIYLRLDDSASATFRNAGANPVSYDAVALPQIGGTYVGTVDLGGTTGHSLAWLVGYAAPTSATLGGGQVLLVDAFDPAGELLMLAPRGGPVATFSVPVPNDNSLVGFRTSTQALHLGGVTPFALSNAQDLRLGH